MIGHFLLQLSPEQEDRVLTSRLWPAHWSTCLVGTAAGYTGMRYELIPGSTGDLLLRRAVWHGGTSGPRSYHVTERYDRLCEKFGTERVNRAIRNRILTNKLWRLQAVPQLAAVI